MALLFITYTVLRVYKSDKISRLYTKRFKTSNLDAFILVLLRRNNGTIKSLFVYTNNRNYRSGLRAAAIKTKQAVFPWELKMRKKTRGTTKKKTVELIYYNC